LPAGIMLTVPTDFLASNYRTALAVPTVLSFLWSHVLVLDLRESPRYLLSKGLVGQCMAELAAIARKNGRPLPASATIVDTAAGEKDPDHTRSYGLMDLWKHPRLRALTVRRRNIPTWPIHWPRSAQRQTYSARARTCRTMRKERLFIRTRARCIIRKRALNRPKRDLITLAGHDARGICASSGLSSGCSTTA
jgi:hypothetical protein